MTQHRGGGEGRGCREGGRFLREERQPLGEPSGNTATAMTVTGVYARGLRSFFRAGGISPGKRSVAASFAEVSAFTQVRKLPKDFFPHLLNLIYLV